MYNVHNILQFYTPNYKNRNNINYYKP